jgi:two-component system, sensor histidine kinase and response regulator
LPQFVLDFDIGFRFLTVEDPAMEQQAIENTIRDKARKWAAEYGEDFVMELAGDFLSDAAARMARLRQALERGDADSLTLEAHTLKSSAANMGALALSALAKRFETAGRNGDLGAVAGDVDCFERQFAAVKASLEKMLSMPGQFLREER